MAYWYEFWTQLLAICTLSSAAARECAMNLKVWLAMALPNSHAICAFRHLCTPVSTLLSLDDACDALELTIGWRQMPSVNERGRDYLESRSSRWRWSDQDNYSFSCFVPPWLQVSGASQWIHQSCQLLYFQTVCSHVRWDFVVNSYNMSSKVGARLLITGDPLPVEIQFFCIPSRTVYQGPQVSKSRAIETAPSAVQIPFVTLLGRRINQKFRSLNILVCLEVSQRVF